MAKVRNAYRAITAAAILARSSNTCDMAVSGTTVSCTNVKMSKVKNVLGASTYSLVDLCTHNNINHWSGFGCTKRTVVSGFLQNSNMDSPYPLGNFACYNHDAPVPAYVGTGHTVTVRVYGVGATATKALSVTIGEPLYKGSDISNDESAVGVALTLWDGQTFLGFGITDLDACTTGADLTAESQAISTTTTITGKIYLCNSLTVFDQNLSNVVCKLSGLTDFNFNAVVLVANYINVQNVGFMNSSNTVITAGECTFSSYNGTLTFPAMHKHTGEVGLVIYARLYHQIAGLVEEQIVFSGDYVADDTIAGQTIYFTNACEGDTPPYADYGYQFQLVFETGT
jgi:hypothetical protein